MLALEMDAATLEGNRGNQPLGGVSIHLMRPDDGRVERLVEGRTVALLPSSWTALPCG